MKFKQSHENRIWNPTDSFGFCRSLNWKLYHNLQRTKTKQKIKQTIETANFFTLIFLFTLFIFSTTFCYCRYLVFHTNLCVCLSFSPEEIKRWLDAFFLVAGPAWPSLTYTGSERARARHFVLKQLPDQKVVTACWQRTDMCYKEYCKDYFWIDADIL